MTKQKITSQDRLINHIRDTAREGQAIDYFETIWNNNPEIKGKLIIKRMMWEAYQYGQQSVKDIKADHLAGHYIAGKKEGHNKMIEIFDNYLKSYPEDIFPRLISLQLEKANNILIRSQGFTLDRLSAHILRDFLIKLKKEIEE